MPKYLLLYTDQRNFAWMQFDLNGVEIINLIISIISDESNVIRVIVILFRSFIKTCIHPKIFCNTFMFN